MAIEGLEKCFAPSDKLCTEVLYVGQENNPVLKIDNFFTDPEGIVDFAAAPPVFESISSDLYPGIRKSFDMSALKPVIHAVEETVRDVFNINPGAIDPVFSAFSIANKAPESTLPIQRIPHFDTSNPCQLAMVVYLFKNDFGGTSFYRHLSTGYESISASRSHVYQMRLLDEARTHGVPGTRYINGDTDLFERTHQVAACFNRALIYKSNLLHSGDLGATYSSDPVQGRLTANAFLIYANG